MALYRIREERSADIDGIVVIYNSNQRFLATHLGVTAVDANFIRHEMAEMAVNGFASCVIVEEVFDAIIGVIDYKLDATVYLSLIMTHANYHQKGIGGAIYQQFEADMRTQGAQEIRMDVVNDYPENLVSFWRKQGFVEQKQIELRWGNKNSIAVIMVKLL